MSKRPHPCLLYAMYLFAAFRSTNPKLKSLESHLLSIALTRLNESVSSLDRLLDAVRAMTILAVYRFQKSQYQAGVLMIGQAMQLAFTLGIHQISSSVWRAPSAAHKDNVSGHPAMRQRRWMLPPAKDPVQHGERINAFWALYCADRIACLVSQWPSSVATEDILTPFPRPIYEYELGIVSLQDDYSLTSMWDHRRPPQILPHHMLASHHILYLRALSLMDRSSKLMYLPDEPDAVFPIEPCDFELAYNSIMFDVDLWLYESNNILAKRLPPPTSTGFSSSRTASVRTPNAYQKVLHGLMSIEADLPPHRRTDWTQPHTAGGPSWWDVDIWSPEIAGLHNMLGVAWMFLFDVYAPYAENTRSVNIARRLVAQMRARPPGEYKGREEDLLVTVCWSFMSTILVREIHRLQWLGQPDQAAAVKKDLDVVIEALKEITKGSRPPEREYDSDDDSDDSGRPGGSGGRSRGGPESGGPSEGPGSGGRPTRDSSHSPSAGFQSASSVMSSSIMSLGIETILPSASMTPRQAAYRCDVMKVVADPSTDFDM